MTGGQIIELCIIRFSKIIHEDVTVIKSHRATFSISSVSLKNYFIPQHSTQSVLQSHIIIYVCDIKLFTRLFKIIRLHLCGTGHMICMVIT